MRRRRFSRSWAISWAVLQFALPAAVTMGDARLEHHSVRGPLTHVESASGRTCRPVHPANCALCQTMSHASVLPADAGAATIVPATAPMPLSAAQTRVSAGPARLSLARAPPLA